MVVSPKEAIIMEVGCGVEPQVEPLLSDYVRAPFSIDVGPQDIRFARKNS